MSLQTASLVMNRKGPSRMTVLFVQIIYSSICPCLEVKINFNTFQILIDQRIII